MQGLLLVMFGGAFGSGARYLVARAGLAWLGPDFPYGTLAVNLIGGVLMGALVGTLARIGTGGETWRLLIGVGVIGGFTTFSTFALDTIVLWQRGAMLVALGYVVVSVAGSIAGVFGGLAIARGLA